jgi:Flp pilus assembly protein TadG
MKLFTKNLRTLLASNKSFSEKGQSLAEMTLGMVILVMLMSGVVDIGRAYFAYIALEDAAGEAALFISTYPKCPYDGIDTATQTIYESTTGALDVTGTSCEAPDNGLWRAIHAGGAGGLIDWSDKSRTVFTVKCYSPSTGLEIPSCTNAATGDNVFVSISYRFNLVSPIIPNISGSPAIMLTGTASEMIVAPKAAP